MYFIRMLQALWLDVIGYAADQVVLVSDPVGEQLIDEGKGEAVEAPAVFVEHEQRLATEGYQAPEGSDPGA
jgi:hypothetical protein